MHTLLKQEFFQQFSFYDDFVRFAEEEFVNPISKGSTQLYFFNIEDTGDISFYDDTGTSQNLKWDASADTLNFVDNAKATFGASNDLQIYHDGNNSRVEDTGTGGLRLIGGNFVSLQSTSGENMVVATKDGAVDLYHNNAKKIETTATGVQVTGTALATTDTDTSNTGNVTLDFSANQNFVLTLTGNTTLVNPSTEQVGQSGFIAFIQDGTGSRTVSLGTDYETAASAGLSLTSTASATDLVPYLVVASGRILLGTPQLAFG